MELRLCQPASIILLVSIAGILYHFLVGDFTGLLYWTVVGVVGTGVFQALCFAGFEPMAWIFMSIPVLVVCFFLAVALFASSVRIKNVGAAPCNKCGQKSKRCGCRQKKKPRCFRCGHEVKKCGCQLRECAR